MVIYQFKSLHDEDTEHKIATLSNVNNVIRKLFEKKARIVKPIKGLASNKTYCLINSRAGLAQIDLFFFYTILGYPKTSVLLSFLANFKSDIIAWLSKPIYNFNLHFYHILDDENNIKTM